MVVMVQEIKYSEMIDFISSGYEVIITSLGRKRRPSKTISDASYGMHNKI